MATSSLQKILLVLDAVAPSASAISYAMGMAMQLNAKLVLAAVVDTSLLKKLSGMHFFVSDELDDLADDLLFQVRKQSRLISEQCEDIGVACEILECRGRLSNAVRALQQDVKADMIVLGNWKDREHAKEDSDIELRLVQEQATVPVCVVK